MAAFHFAWVEQGGTSLYDQFVPYISSREVLRIVSSIYATEAVHYAIFRDSLNGITAFQNGDGKLVVPDLTEGKEGSSHVFPKRCTFLSEQLPTCSVIRPSSTGSGRRAGGRHRPHRLQPVQGPAAGLLPGAHRPGQGRRRRRLKPAGCAARAPPSGSGREDCGARAIAREPAKGNAAHLTARGASAMDIGQQRIDLACALRWAARLGMQEGVCNHFSLAVAGEDGRIRGDRFLINPYGLHWSEITASSLVLCDAEGNVLEGKTRSSPRPSSSIRACT